MDKYFETSLRKAKSSSELYSQTEKMISAAPHCKHPGSREHFYASSVKVLVFFPTQPFLIFSLHKKYLTADEVYWFV